MIWRVLGSQKEETASRRVHNILNKKWRTADKGRYARSGTDTKCSAVPGAWTEF
jgi:hypothetical protein